jgi:hypothetical protein
MQDLKKEVKKQHARKVNSWNRLVTNIYSKANENQYYKDQSEFQLSVFKLVEEFKLMKRRGMV